MQTDDSGPTLAQGLLRLGTLLGVTAIGGYFLWSLFSENAALNRLATTAKSFRYTQSCDVEGRPVSSGVANCIDLNHYVFIYGPVMTALRRECTGKPATILFFEKGKVARTEINRVEKLLRFRGQNGTNSPCGLYR
jgi:hypothetical protein